MNIIRYGLTRLPEKWQKKLTLYLISSGRIFTTPIWKMLFQTFSFYGGDEQKLRKTLVRKHDSIESVVNAICDLGKRTKDEADLLAQQIDPSQSDIIRDKYLEAALYYFMEYFFVYEPEQSKRIFSLATKYYQPKT